MRPGVSIEPTPEDPPNTAATAASGTSSAPGASPLLAAVTGLRAEGTDRDGNVRVTLDGTGRMVDLQVVSVPTENVRRGIERAVRTAYDEAWTGLEAQRQAAAQQLLTDGRLQISGLTAELRQLSEHADARLQEAFTRLQQTADRVSGGNA